METKAIRVGMMMSEERMPFELQFGLPLTKGQGNFWSEIQTPTQRLIISK